MIEPIFWYLTPGGLKSVYDDSDPLFLRYSSYYQGKFISGSCSKRLSDHMVKIGHWRQITNPIEAYFLETIIERNLLCHK